MVDDAGNENGKASPPYIAFQSLKTLCGTLKEHGVPGRIDRSVLGNFSGAVGGQIMTALKFLRLTTAENHPAPLLRELVAAYGTDDWASKLAEVLRLSYAPIFELNLESASPAQFNEKFRSAYPGKEETLRKCQGFFINAVREAGIKTSAYIMKNKKPRSGPTKRRPSSSAKVADTPGADGTGSTTVNDTRGDNVGGEKGKPGQQQPNDDITKILLEKFPTFDPNWPQDAQDKWFIAYDKLLDRGGRK